ncbi:MAG: hypothetical protein HYR62_01960 [Actinobacteria bacterium]|nr:hypothetical protein [Actinomycetota bacterium]MBI3687248.1 hypothetical protein [Actinomycetota bacterium]
MPVVGGSSAARGYGAEHEAIRERLLWELRERPGQPCVRCGKPMWPWQRLDAGHSVPASMGGVAERLEHASCNRSAGARTRNRRAAVRRAASTPPSRDW